MNPFKDFNEFIANFVPGVVLFCFLLLGASLFLDKNLLSKNLFASYVFLAIIGGTISGLFVDDFRHFCLEGKLEEKWANSNGYNLDKIGDFINYVPLITIDLYKLIRDEYYYFYEFDTNIALSLAPAILVVPVYLYKFYNITSVQMYIVGLLILCVCGAFWKFGLSGYYLFLDIFIDTIEINQPGFKEKIKK